MLGWPVREVPTGERVGDDATTLGSTVGELFATVGCVVVLMFG